MSWLDVIPGSEVPARETPKIFELPLFPLGSVLFPAGVLGLKVFEQRYLDMAADCLRHKQPFGVCLIARGHEVGETATPHAVGTLAYVSEADMDQPGILLLKARGGRRFRILTSAPQSDKLLRGTVEQLDETTGTLIPEPLAGVVTLLRKVAHDLGPERMPEPHAFDDAAWVGYRLADILPVQSLAKQKLLELNDPISRLEIIHAYLAQRRLVD